MPDEGSYKHILFAVEDGVATITLNRPKRLNAFHFALGAELASAYARCDEDDAVRAVVLTGAGKAFCAGRTWAVATRRSKTWRAPDAQRTPGPGSAESAVLPPGKCESR